MPPFTAPPPPPDSSPPEDVPATKLLIYRAPHFVCLDIDEAEDFKGQSRIRTCLSFSLLESDFQLETAGHVFSSRMGGVRFLLAQIKASKYKKIAILHVFLHLEDIPLELRFQETDPN